MKTLQTLFICLTGLNFLTNELKAQLHFNSPDSLFSFANRNSATLKISEQQSLIAKWTKVAALANVVNFKSPVSYAATNNFLLPVNFIPAEAFGGPAGSFREITLGQQYVSSFNVNPQIDIINPQNWARVKSAEVNKELTGVTNALTKKSLLESITAAYYNYISLSEQIRITQLSLINSDSIALIVKNKFDEGITRQQDYNNARVNVLNVKDKLQQLEAAQKQQLNAVKILCDIPAATIVNLSEEMGNDQPAPKTTSLLEAKHSLLQSQLQRSEWNASRLSMLPVLSLVYFQGWQHNSNSSYTDNAARWIQSRYLGFRITVPFPPDAGKLSQNYTNKANYRISQYSYSHQQLQNEMQNQNLELEEEKTKLSVESAREIVDLKRENYQKSMNQYKAGIVSADLLINALSELLNSELSYVSAKTARAYAVRKILINNSFK